MTSRSLGVLVLSFVAIACGGTERAARPPEFVRDIPDPEPAKNPDNPLRNAVVGKWKGTNKTTTGYPYFAVVFDADGSLGYITNLDNVSPTTLPGKWVLDGTTLRFVVDHRLKLECTFEGEKCAGKGSAKHGVWDFQLELDK